tara:strand:- start:291 stop:545 length:255 start_codon:yes stop_codon:yes gene_type:complete
MITKYEHEVQNKGSPEMNTKDDLKVILTGGTNYVNKTVGETAPTNWVVMFAVIMVVIAIVPLVPIAIAFFAGHYMNWWSSKNLK